MSAATHLHPQFDGEQAVDFYRDMKRIRAFELRCAELYSAGHIRGFLHLYVGEEAVATGVCGALQPQDAVVATYREHGHALLRGLSAGACMAEMYGKVEGCSRGRGGSMHLFDGPRRFYGGNAIVGGGLPLAAGLAWGDKRMGRDAVTVCFFGEGAVAEGEFHEALNLAALWRLPVLFCCENNGYAMGTALARSQASPSVVTRALAYGMPAEAVDGMDVLAVHEAAQRAITAVRAGAGPWLLELRTYRFRAHSMFDAELYRDAEEVAWWKERGPILRLGATLREAGLLDDAGDAAIDALVTEEVDAGVAFAEAATDEPVSELLRFVLSEEPEGFVPARDGEVQEMTYREAVRSAISEAIEADERVFLVGEDVGAYGGCYAVTKGLLDRYGPERIIDAPLSESGFTGAGIGAAAAGARPIVEVMTVNFSLLALDQILNTAATLRHMSGNQCSAPVVIRMATGAGKQLAAQHSHSLEGWYAHIPGLKVLAPATVQDARDMLAAALADPNPVVIFEHVLLYAASGSWDPGQPCDLRSAAVRREGDDVSLITYGGSLPTCLAAAEELAAAGVSAEVLDLRILRPLDDDAILATARKTGRAVIVDEGWRTGSLAAEIAARIQEHAFYDLDAPVQRVCTAEVPIPYPQHLEQAALPSVERIVAAAQAAMAGAV
jgi:2-oxoisovalerate dehydrogenase E1 component